MMHQVQYDDLTPPLLSSPLPPCPLMDRANAHHQQRPSGGDSFLTEGHNRPAEIIHSIHLLIHSVICLHLSSTHPFTHSLFLDSSIHLFDHWFLYYCKWFIHSSVHLFIYCLYAFPAIQIKVILRMLTSTWVSIPQSQSSRFSLWWCEGGIR